MSLEVEASVECLTSTKNMVEVSKNDIVGVNEFDITITSSQTNSVTSACLACKKTTTRKDRVFECKSCKELIHYSCSRLPAYTIYSLKISKRQFVCEICAAPTEGTITNKTKT